MKRLKQTQVLEGRVLSKASLHYLSGDVQGVPALSSLTEVQEVER